MKASDKIRQDLMDRYGFRDVAFSDRLSEEQKVNIGGRMFNDIHVMAERVGLQDKDIGLNGLSVVMNPAGDQTSLGGYFPEGKTISCIYYNNGLSAGSFAHEWYHAFDYAMAEEMGLESRTLSEGIRNGEAPSRDMTGQSAFRTRVAEMDIIDRSKETEKWLNENGQPTRSGALSSPHEVTARVFSAMVTEEKSKFLGDPVTEQSWNPGGFHFEPTEKDKKALGPAVLGPVIKAEELGYFEKMNQEREALPEIHLNPDFFVMTDKASHGRRPSMYLYHGYRMDPNIDESNNIVNGKNDSYTMPERSQIKTTPDRDLNQNGIEDAWEGFRDENANGISDDTDQWNHEAEEKDYTISDDELKALENESDGPKFGPVIDLDEWEKEMNEIDSPLTNYELEDYTISDDELEALENNSETKFGTVINADELDRQEIDYDGPELDGDDFER